MVSVQYSWVGSYEPMQSLQRLSVQKGRCRRHMDVLHIAITTHLVENQLVLSLGTNEDAFKLLTASKVAILPVVTPCLESMVQTPAIGRCTGSVLNLQCIAERVEGCIGS